MCDHELDGVKLGKYAVKKVAVGNFLMLEKP